MDTESLCIIAGEKVGSILILEQGVRIMFSMQVWSVRIDLHVLDHCGNIIDCAAIAAITALKYFRLYPPCSYQIPSLPPSLPPSSSSSSLFSFSSSFLSLSLLLPSSSSSHPPSLFLSFPPSTFLSLFASNDFTYLHRRPDVTVIGEEATIVRCFS